MIIERDLSPYVMLREEGVGQAVQKLVEHEGRILFVLAEPGRLEGVLTKGDILRWLGNRDSADMDTPLSEVMNTDFLFVHEDEPTDLIREHLQQTRFVPILDDRDRLKAIARRREDHDGIQLGDFRVHEDAPAFIIAEIGINHNGSLELARKLIDAAAEADASCAKFQMRDVETLYRNQADSDDPREDLGSQYTMDLVENSQLSREEMFEAFDYCRERGIMPFCTPWDTASLEVLEEYGMPGYKVASADFTNHDFLRKLARTGKPLICSTGMTTESEIRESIDVLQNVGAKYALLHCVSCYPAPYKDVNLSYLHRLGELGECSVGYSGHERGFHIPLGAVALGADIVEKHITLDRSMKGNDHKVSLLPDEFKTMVQQIRDLEASLGHETSKKLSQGERINRENLAKSLVAAEPLEPGDVINETSVQIRSPGRGLQPNRKDELLGRRASRPLEPGDFFFASDLEDERVQPRDYSFRRPWGVPVRFHDFRFYVENADPDFLEYHLSYKDLDVDLSDFFTEDETFGQDLVVHSPDVFEGDHLLDLCSTDEAYRRRSIDELQRVVDLTRKLKPYFRTDTPRVVASSGGFSQHEPLSGDLRATLYENAARSLDALDESGVEVIMQSLPPFPWYFGGQYYLNAFVRAEPIRTFCREHDRRICLDVSHARMTCNFYDSSFRDYIRKVAGATAHLHLADASGVDGEGLQIGEGEIDFSALGEFLDEDLPETSFIPEIWQGHKDEGKRFWQALDRLEEVLA